MYKKWYLPLIFIALSQASLDATSVLTTIGTGLRASGRAVATVFRKGRVAIPLTIAALLVSDRMQVLYYHTRQTRFAEHITFAQQQLALQEKRCADAQQASRDAVEDMVVVRKHELDFQQEGLRRLEASPNSPARLAVKKHYYDAALERGSYAYRLWRFSAEKSRAAVVALQEYNRQRADADRERAREARRAARGPQGR